MASLSPFPAAYYPLGTSEEEDEGNDDFLVENNNDSEAGERTASPRLASRGFRTGDDDNDGTIAISNTNTFDTRTNGKEHNRVNDASTKMVDFFTMQHRPSMDLPISNLKSLAQDRPHHQPPRQQQQLAVTFLLVCTVLVFADQNLMAPNLTAIARDFGFDDAQRDRKLGGDIAVAFFLLGAPASFLIGTLGDSPIVNRIHLFSATVCCGEGACIATFWVTTYVQLYVCRALTGLSVGGALPLVYSLLGDLFAGPDRHAAASSVGIGMGIGIAVGQGVAGFLGPTFGWRLPFLVVGVPAWIAAMLLAVCVSDPERGGMEPEHVTQEEENDHQQQQQHKRYDELPQFHGSNNSEERTPSPPTAGRNNQTETTGETRRKTISRIEMSPINLDRNHRQIAVDVPYTDKNEKSAELALEHRSTLPGSENSSTHDTSDSYCSRYCATIRSLLSTPTLVLALLQGPPGCVPWGIVNTYWTDYMAVNRGMTVEAATLTVLLFGVGNFLGMLVGGHGGSYLYRKNPRYPAVLAGCMAALGCFPFWILLNRVSAQSSFWWVTAPISILAGLCSGVTGPIIKATVQNVTLPQTRGQAFALFNTFDDFGRGLGPKFVAVLIDKLGGRTPAFNIGVIGWMACGILNVCVTFTVERDERTMRQRAGLARRTTNNNLQPESVVSAPAARRTSTPFSGDLDLHNLIPSELLQPSLGKNII